MSTHVLDSGALIALENDDRGMWALLKRVAETQRSFQVPAAVLVEVCADRPRQARLNMALKRCEIVALTEEIAFLAAQLKADSGVDDVADTTTVATAALATVYGDVTIHTSDLGDISRLSEAARRIPDLVLNEIRINRA